MFFVEYYFAAVETICIVRMNCMYVYLYHSYIIIMLEVNIDL